MSNKLAAMHELDCITVDLSGVKRQIDQTVQRAVDALVSLLGTQLLDQVEHVNFFLDKAIDVLSSRLTNLADFTTVQLQWREMQPEVADVRAASKQVTALHQMLVAQAPASKELAVITARLSMLPTKWENFENAYSGFNAKFTTQRQELKDLLQQQKGQVQDAINKFAERWHAEQLNNLPQPLPDDVVCSARVHGCTLQSLSRTCAVAVRSMAMRKCTALLWINCAPPLHCGWWCCLAGENDHVITRCLAAAVCGLEAAGHECDGQRGLVGAGAPQV